MAQELVKQLVDTYEQHYFGRVRTYKFLEEYLNSNHDHFPLKLVPMALYHLPPSAGWEFVKANKLEWVIESDDDEGIVSQFLRMPLSDKVRKGLSAFLSSRLPGPVVIEGVFAGEDMGITPPLELFEKRYIMDPDEQITERVKHLERAIKSTWAEVFTNRSKKFMQNLELPVENWMVSISLTVPSAPRRGSFYYPDITAVVWGGAGVTPKGFTSGGWWEPMHPEFPDPVAFTPGEPIGPGASELLAMEAKPGCRPLTLIPRQLAKTHGTMNLTVVKEDQPVTKKKGSLIEGEKSPLTVTLARLVEEVGELLGEPVVIHLTLQPNSYTGEPELFLNSVRPFVPKRLSMLMPRPSKNNVDYLFDAIPAKGQGSGFARYFVHVDSEPKGEILSKLEKFLDRLVCEGEAAVLIADAQCSKEMVLRLAKKECVLGICYGQDLREETDVLFQVTVPFVMKHLDKMVELKKWLGAEILVSPKPVKLVVQDNLGVAWL